MNLGVKVRGLANPARLSRYILFLQPINSCELYFHLYLLNPILTKLLYKKVTSVNYFQLNHHSTTLYDKYIQLWV